MKKLSINTIILTLSLILGFGLHRTLTAELLMNFLPQLSLHPWVHFMSIAFEGFFIFVIFRLIIDKTINKTCTYMLWGCYFCTLLFILFIRMAGMKGINLNPLGIIKNIHTDHLFFITIIMNIFLFVPLGYLFRKKTFIVSLISAIVIFLGIETIQYTFKVGIFDVDDIILNVIGFMIGYNIVKIMNKTKSKTTFNSAT